MPKRSLRQQILARRSALALDEWQRSSSTAQERLLALPEYRQAACIALYAPIRNESDTALVLQDAFSSGKRVLYPAVCGEHLVFRQVESIDSLESGTFGILEPCPTGQDHHADEADLIVVPGVAFDSTGHRIGYGKGFYDRFLHHSGGKACLIGLCHDFQVVSSPLPAEGHDIRMDMVVTDLRLIRCGSNRHRHSEPDSHTGG